MIPAFDEESVILPTIRDLKSLFENIVLVDDCSTDGTALMASQAGAHVCRHPINLGQGASLQTGIEYALSKGAKVIVTFDADGQHRSQDAKLFADMLGDGNLDVILSSRFKGSAEGMPRLKRAVLGLAVWFTRLTTGLPVSDTHNGLRAFSCEAAQQLRIRQNRMAHASEILEQIARLKLRWIEMPGTVRYTSYSIHKGQKMSGALEILKDLFIVRLRS